MIARYARPGMERVWSDAHRLTLWLDVELAVTRTRERHGLVPAGTADAIGERASIDAGRMEAIEAEVRHDVIAFLTMISESAGEGARHLHAGLTSSDLVDTALALQIVEAAALLRSAVVELRSAAGSLARRHRNTPMIGRTHGMHAEPVTFGLKCLVWEEELRRNLKRLDAAGADCAVGKFSGAVGTLVHISPEIEAQALGALGLSPEPVANQVVQRDRHAALLCALAVLGGTLDKIATEIRHLQRSEVAEAAEPFASTQKGSSAMPHKRNPVRCERVSGLARLLRGYVVTGLENQPLWHERDISHSSAERVILPDAFLCADFMVAELTDILTNLHVDEARMRRNLESGGGLAYSQRVLLALTEAGLPRDEAYRIVQRHALRALDQGVPFREGLASDPAVSAKLDATALDRCFDFTAYLSSVDAIFERVERAGA
jgi:adenylosuccinate lyase